MEKIILIGGGGHCRSVIDVIEAEGKYQIAGVVDKAEMLGETILDYEVIGSDKDLCSFAQEIHHAFITVGQIKSPDLRIKLYKEAKNAGFIIPSIISPRAYVSKYAVLEEGVIVMHDALINASARIGANCIINTKATVEHDCIIEGNCHVSTGVIVNGGVHIEKNCFIGSNATLKQSIVVEKNSFVKAGSLVV